MPIKTISFTDAKNLPGDGPFVVEAVEKDDKRIVAITFANPDGATAFRIKYQDYSVKVQVPTPPAMVKRTRVTAINQTAKVTVTEDIENSWDVTTRKQELIAAGFDVVTEEVEVLETV